MQNGSSGVVVVKASELEARIGAAVERRLGALEPMIERLIRRALEGARVIGPIADLAGELALAIADANAEPATDAAPVREAAPDLATVPDDDGDEAPAPKPAPRAVQWISSTEAARLLRISVAGVLYLARAGRIRSKRDGSDGRGAYLFDKASVMERADGVRPPRKAGSGEGGDWISIAEAATELGLSERGIAYLRRAGEIKARIKPVHKGRGQAPFEYDRASVLAQAAKRAAQSARA